MSVACRLLRENLPVPATSQGQFHTDAKKVRAWIEALPRANAASTQLQLRQALESLAAQTLSSGQRLAVLEELRPAILEQSTLLEGSYATSPLPLPAEQARAAEMAEALQLLLAHGYRLAVAELCGASGSVPFLKGGAVTQALVRSAGHYKHALKLAWRIYHPAPTGAWQGLHRIHRFAVEVKLESKPAEDPTYKPGSSRDVAGIYQTCLLVAITNPYGYSQAEQDEMWSLVRAYRGRCNLHRKSPHDNAPAVPEDADHGPGSARDDEASGWWLDLRPFEADVDRALAQLVEGYANLVPGPGVALRLSEDELWRLKRAFGLLAARRHSRLPATHAIDSVVGLSALHFYLAGQRDFDTFLRQSTQSHVHVNERAAWANVGSDAQRMPRLPAEVKDQSLSGYRLVWRNADQARLRIGELVGLGFADPDELPEWMIAVVRWLRYEGDGSLSAGVELISRRSAAVALRAGLDASGGTLRALELAGEDGKRWFVAPAALDGHAEQIEVVLDAESAVFGEAVKSRQTIERCRFTMHTGDYVVLQAEAA